jgi:hypothetical protein
MSHLRESHFYYSGKAYASNQTLAEYEASKHKFIHKITGSRLPWGNTQDVMPERVLTELTPESMRYWEDWEKEKKKMNENGTYISRPLEGMELHYKHDHEMIRHAQLPFRSQFWLSLKTWGKWITIMLTPIALLAHLTIMPASEKTPWDFTSNLLINFYSWLIGIPLLCWIVGYIIIQNFPKFWFRPPIGPLWEINRRTGLITKFDYTDFKDQKKAKEIKIPFYEFDAYIITNPDPQGLPMNGLSLAHRYSNIAISFNDLIVPDNTTQQPCALWDFLQNFMDISRPLPEIPAHEPYRHLDPVTASHDLKNSRNARYWIDMENDTFNIKVKQMRARIDNIDTFNRPNLMAMHVKYSD